MQSCTHMNICRTDRYSLIVPIRSLRQIALVFISVLQNWEDLSIRYNIDHLSTEYTRPQNSPEYPRPQNSTKLEKVKRKFKIVKN